jgi:hypothetical protein
VLHRNLDVALTVANLQTTSAPDGALPMTSTPADMAGFWTVIQKTSLAGNGGRVDGGGADAVVAQRRRIRYNDDPPRRAGAIG